MNKLFCEEQEQTRMSVDIVLIYGKESVRDKECAREGKCAGFACGNRGGGSGQGSSGLDYARGSRAVHIVPGGYTESRACTQSRGDTRSSGVIYGKVSGYRGWLSG